MKLKHLFVSLFAAAAVFAGCEKEKNEDSGLPVISIENAEIEVAKEGGAPTVTFTANRDWTAKVQEGETWLGVSAVSGKASADKQTITITVDPNDAFDRSATVTIALAGGLGSKDITVKQAGKGENPDVGGKGEGTLESPYDAVKALALAEELDEAGKIAGVYVAGKVCEVKEISTDFGNATYSISVDGTTEGATFSIYRGYYFNGEKFTSTDQLKVGDEVVVLGDIVNYKGNTPQLTQGSQVVKHNGNTAPEPEPVEYLDVKDHAADGAVSVVMGEQEWENAKAITGLKLSDGTLLTFDKGKGGNEPKYYESGNNLRMYPQNTLVIEGVNEIETVLFKVSSTYVGGDNLSAEPGKVVVESDNNKVFINEVNADKTTFTNGHSVNKDGQLRIEELVIVYKGGKLPEDPQVKDPVVATVAEFLAAEESKYQPYKLTGTISEIKSEEYGNFNLTDETGTVYVYGLTATDLGYGASNDKSFASLGLKEGDVVTLIGFRSSYNGEVQVANAYYVSHVAGGDEPEVKEPVVATVAEFLAAAESDNQPYTLTGVISGSVNEQYGNFDLVDDTGTVYVYGLTKTNLGYGTKNDQSYKELGLKKGDTVTLTGFRGSYTDKEGNKKDEVVYAYYVDHKPGEGGGDEPGELGEYDSNVTWTLGTNAYSEKAHVNGVENVPVLKLGKSKATGDATIAIPAGKSKLSFYGLAWNTNVVSVSIQIGEVEKTIELTSNEGFKSSSPYTVTVADTDKYTVDFGTTLAEETVLTIKTVKTGDTRGMFFGIKAE